MANNQRKPKLNIPMLLASVLFCLTLVTTCLVSSLFARYTASSTGFDSARVAVMAMNKTVTLNSPLIAAPGEEKVFTVRVTNKEGARVCEVAQQYILYVENMSGNMDLTYEFVGATPTNYIDAAGNEHIAVTGYFAPGEERSITYTVKVKWNASQPERMAFEVDALRIVVLASQVD